MLPKELPQELELAPGAPDTTDFTYFKHAEMSFSDRGNFSLNTNSKIELGAVDDGEYEYSEHFGNVRKNSSNKD